MSPISEFFNGTKFDSKTQRLMGIAYEMAHATLKFENQTYIAQEIIAKRIIALAKYGMLDPDRLCEQALDAVHEGNPPSRD